MSGPVVEERLRTALREAALTIQESPPPMMDLAAHPTRARRGPRVLVAGLAFVLVLATLTAAVVLSGGTHDTGGGAPGGPSQVAVSRIPTLEADVVVFMRVDAQPNQIDAVHRLIGRLVAIGSFAFVDRQAALADFKRIFRSKPDLTRNVTPDALPVSFRLVLRDCSAQPAVITRLKPILGVDAVNAGAGFPHATAKRLDDQQTLPPDRIDGHCGYHQPTRRPAASLTITALPTLRYDSNQYTVRAGVVEITLASGGGTHSLAFADSKFRNFVLTAPSGPIRGKVDLRPGAYIVYDPIPGHRDAGEQASITAR